MRVSGCARVRSELVFYSTVLVCLRARVHACVSKRVSHVFLPPLVLAAINFYIYLLRLMGFPGATRGIEPACQCRRCKRPGFNPWVGKILRRKVYNPLQCSCLENPMNRGSWRAIVHEVAESDTTEVT